MYNTASVTVNLSLILEQHSQHRFYAFVSSCMLVVMLCCLFWPDSPGFRLFLLCPHVACLWNHLYSPRGVGDSVPWCRHLLVPIVSFLCCPWLFFSVSFSSLKLWYVRVACVSLPFLYAVLQVLALQCMLGKYLRKTEMQNRESLVFYRQLIKWSIKKSFAKGWRCGSRAGLAIMSPWVQTPVPLKKKKSFAKLWIQ
jgi:hypothetical protein